MEDRLQIPECRWGVSKGDVCIVSVFNHGPGKKNQLEVESFLGSFCVVTVISLVCMVAFDNFTTCTSCCNV